MTDRASDPRRLRDIWGRSEPDPDADAYAKLSPSEKQEYVRFLAAKPFREAMRERLLGAAYLALEGLHQRDPDDPGLHDYFIQLLDLAVQLKETSTLGKAEGTPLAASVLNAAEQRRFTEKRFELAMPQGLLGTAYSTLETLYRLDNRAPDLRDRFVQLLEFAALQENPFTLGYAAGTQLASQFLLPAEQQRFAGERFELALRQGLTGTACAALETLYRLDNRAPDLPDRFVQLLELAILQGNPYALGSAARGLALLLSPDDQERFARARLEIAAKQGQPPPAGAVRSPTASPLPFDEQGLAPTRFYGAVDEYLSFPTRNARVSRLRPTCDGPPKPQPRSLT